jgi:hypothetical protein
VQDFTLETNEIHGRVTDPDVRPLVGVRITVARAEAGIDMDPPPVVVLAEDDRGTPNVQWRTPRGAREARTDAQGQYVLRGLVENTPIVVGSAGDEVEHAQKDPITLAPGEVRQGVDFVLRRAGRVRVELAGDLAEGTWYLVDFVRGTGTDAETARQVWLAQWNRDEVVGSLLPGAYVVRLSQMTMEGNATPVAESAVEVEVGKLARLVLRVP